MKNNRGTSPIISGGQSGEKNTFFYQSSLIVPVIFFALGLLILATNAGSYAWSTGFSNIMQSIVPSIAGTAIHAPEPDNARLILSLTWFTSVAYALILCIYSRVDLVRWRSAPMKPKVFVALFIVVGMLLVVFMANISPAPGSAGRSGIFMYQMVHGSMISLLLLQAGFILMYSVVFYIVLWLPIEVFRRIFKGDNT